MSMYIEILDASLNERSRHAQWPTTDEAISALLACGDQLSTTISLRPGTDWSSIVLASHVAYDIALIELARSLGLDCDPGTFYQPERRREELREEILGRGIDLYETDRPVGGAPHPRQRVFSGARVVNPR